MKRYRRNNCDAQVRAQIKDKWGRTITLLGRYAFEWSIVIEANGKLTIQSFSKGEEARKEYNKYTLKRKQNKYRRK